MAMELKELRLELLKLTYNHGREAREAVDRAKELETYVLEVAKSKAAESGKTTRTPPKHLQRGNS